MIYYHGTDRYFKELRLPYEKSFKDFGIGVYLAETEKHAREVAYWRGGLHAYVYAYKVNMTEIKKEFNVKEFRGASLEWIKYIIENRTGYTGYDYDLIIGPTADAKAQTIISNFVTRCTHPTDRDYKNLKEDLNIGRYGTQICIKSQKLLNIFNNSKIKETMLR